MGLFGSTLFEAQVPLWNLKAFDVGTGDPVLAAVDLPDELAPVEGQPPLRLLGPLVAVTLLRNCSKQSELASPMMQLFGMVANAIMSGEEDARGLAIRESVHVDAMQLLDEDAHYRAAAVLAVGAPELYSGARTRAEKTFRAQLRQGRGPVFGAVRGVGNGYQAAFGFLALIEHIAHVAPYEDVVAPAAEALDHLCDLFFDELEERPPSFSEAGVLNALLLERLRETDS